MLENLRKLFFQRFQPEPKRTWTVVGQEGSYLLCQEYADNVLTGEPFRVLHGRTISG